MVVGCGGVYANCNLFLLVSSESLTILLLICPSFTDNNSLKQFNSPSYSSLCQLSFWLKSHFDHVTKPKYSIFPSSAALDTVGLKEKGFTHVLNTAHGKGALQCNTNHAMYKKVGIKFSGERLVYGAMLNPSS